jgi:hypothetical protein
MAKRIATPEVYTAHFGDAQRRERALEYALDIRKFEIELYWKRATYFWTLLGASFAAYFLLASAKPSQSAAVFLVSCIGLILSVGWYLVNRGSKYWQTNWERHVDSLEDEFIGPLYKTTIAIEQFRLFHFWDGYPYSVSKINQLISLYIVFVWVGNVISSFPDHPLPSYIVNVSPWVLGFTTAVFLVLLLFIGRSGSQGRKRPVDFFASELAVSDKKAADSRDVK